MSCASTIDKVSRSEGKSEVDKYFVVRKESVRANRYGAECDLEAGKFNSAEMGSGSKVER